jgi:hypothetical protein
MEEELRLVNLELQKNMLRTQEEDITQVLREENLIIEYVYLNYWLILINTYRIINSISYP